MIARLAADARAHPLRWTMAGLCLLMFIPGLDIAFSGLFYAEDAGFHLNQRGLFVFAREAVPTIIIGTLIFCVLLWIAGLCFRQSFWEMTTRRVGYLVLTLLIGPGLIVESLLKSHWGRARPNEIVAFGGDATFTPPVWIAQECGHNCSFVSGHAAIGFWLSVYGFLLPPRWRLRGVIAGMIAGAAMGLVRVIQGAHFLSDIVFAGAFVLMVNAVLAHILLRERTP